MTSLVSSIAAPALRSSLQVPAAITSQSLLVDASPAAARRSLYEAGSLPGVHNLDPVLTINSQSKAPVFRYNGLDASSAGWPAWGYGSALAPIAHSLGQPITYDFGSCFQGPLDGAFKQPGGTGGCFAASSAALGAINTEDFVLELLLRQPDTLNASHYWLAKAGAGSNARWEIRTNANGTVIFLVSTTSTSVQATATGPRTSQWSHVMVFGRRLASVQIYVDRVIGGAVSIASLAGVSLDNPAAPLATAQNGTGANAFAGAIAYMALWAGASWLDNHRQDSLVDARWQALFFGGAQP